MCRNSSCSKQGFNRGSWSATEDTILANYVRAHGEGRWTKVPKRAGLSRCPRSCRLRWLNYLRPDIKRGNITDEEEDLIIRLHNLLGNRWSLIAGRLPGRTDNEIKNYWNTVLKKKKKTKSVAPVASIVPACTDEEGNCQSQKEIRIPQFESSGSSNEASVISQRDTCKNDFRESVVSGDLRVDASFSEPGVDFDLFSPLIGSENEDDSSGHVLDLDFFKEDITARVGSGSPVSFDYDASIGQETSDDWFGWDRIQPCGGVDLESLTAFCQSETEYASLWADLV